MWVVKCLETRYLNWVSFTVASNFMNQNKVKTCCFKTKIALKVFNWFEKVCNVKLQSSSILNVDEWFLLFQVRTSVNAYSFCVNRFHFLGKNAIVDSKWQGGILMQRFHKIFFCRYNMQWIVTRIDGFLQNEIQGDINKADIFWKGRISDTLFQLKVAFVAL